MLVITRGYPHCKPRGFPQKKKADCPAGHGTGATMGLQEAGFKLWICGDQRMYPLVMTNIAIENGDL